MGYDQKVIYKQIRRTPGPAEYNTICHDTSTGVGGSAVKIITHNHSLNKGGLKRPETSSHKDRILRKSLNIKSPKQPKVKLTGVRLRDSFNGTISFSGQKSGTGLVQSTKALSNISKKEIFIGMKDTLNFTNDSEVNTAAEITDS